MARTQWPLAAVLCVPQSQAHAPRDEFVYSTAATVVTEHTWLGLRVRG
jgi:hypothetical protein